MKKSLVVAMIAIFGIGSLGLVQILAQADTARNQSTWTRMRGVIHQWGAEPAFGWINAHIRMIDVNGTHREWAWAHATWSDDTPRINCSQPPTENFTLVHYSARLFNTTDITEDSVAYDLLIAGLWNVTKITINVYVDENGNLLHVERTVEPYLPDLVTGEFRVLGNWGRFELDIAGMPLLTGRIVGYMIAYREIKMFDINDDDKVDILDLVRVARRYRFVPGLFNYDDAADVNGDSQIDIADLTTISANIDV